MAELAIDGWLGGDGPVDATVLADAIDLAADQDQVTWLTEKGKRVAALVPVDQAEALERATQITAVLPLDKIRKILGDG